MTFYFWDTNKKNPKNEIKNDILFLDVNKKNPENNFPKKNSTLIQ